MINNVELRYPYHNVIDFLSGYAFNPSALHIDFAYLGILFLIYSFFMSHKDFSLLKKMSILYFSLAAYNNPAFSMYGVDISDFIGISIIGIFLVKIYFSLEDKSCISNISVTLGVIFFLSLIHVFLINYLYKELNVIDGVFLGRIIVTSKVLVLAINIWIFNKEISTLEDIKVFILTLCKFVALAMSVYLLEFIELVFLKIIPYGTYFPASVGIASGGYFPCFGSVSIERGHFGKMMTPFFPLILFSLIKYKQKMVFWLFIFITLINISASSLSFFACYVLLSVIYFRQDLILWIKKLSLLKKIFLIFISTLIFFVLGGLFMGLIYKIYVLAFLGNDYQNGGRGSNILWQYWDLYPLGTSYGGSSYRVVEGLPEIDSGIFVFLSQFSIFAIPIISMYVCLLIDKIIKVNNLERVTKYCLKIGILVMPIIFISDVIWFISTMWLPLVLVDIFYNINNNSKKDLAI